MTSGLGLLACDTTLPADGPDGALTDAAPLDAAPPDAGPPDGPSMDGVGPDAPVATDPLARPIYPPNGHCTGSALVPSGAAVVDHPLRPKLMWRPAVDATEYQVQLTSECQQGAFASCAFASPEIDERVKTTSFRPASPLPVSKTAPVGRRYYWRVRACNTTACTAFSAVRYLDVGRLSNDYNGDGYADLAIGAFLQDNPEVDEGTTYVYFGSATGVKATPDVVLDSPQAQKFGIAVASAGDLDGDGYADLVVGASGGAYVYLGSAAGPPSQPTLSIARPSGQTNDNFGARLAGAGDVDGDGYADLAISAYNYGSQKVGEGRVYLYLGSSTGPKAAPDVTLDNPLGQPVSAFGIALASAGDLDGDGFVDLVVGAEYQDNPEKNEGGAYVFFGSATGLKTTAGLALDNPAAQAGGAFGASVAGAGDVNGDGYADLLIGASYQNNPTANEGSAYLYFGSPTGPKDVPNLTLDSPAGEKSGHFGRAVASAGDVNGDGYADLIVGANDVAAYAGSAYVYLGSAAGPKVTPDISLDNPQGAALAQSFGDFVASAGDIDGDGYGEIAVGATLQDNPETDEGSAYIYKGSSTGLKTTPDVSLDNPADQAGGRFGSVAK